jgi:hypothetical protein
MALLAWMVSGHVWSVVATIYMTCTLPLASFAQASLHVTVSNTQTSLGHDYCVFVIVRLHTDLVPRISSFKQVCHE